jgi:hypothetical protein
MRPGLVRPLRSTGTGNDRTAGGALLATPGRVIRDNLAGFGDFAGVASNSPPDKSVVNDRFGAAPAEPSPFFQQNRLCTCASLMKIVTGYGLASASIQSLRGDDYKRGKIAISPLLISLIFTHPTSVQ